jgi:hypothetical protein
MCERMNERVTQTKRDNDKLSREHRREVDNTLGNFRREIQNFRQDVEGNPSTAGEIEDSLSRLQETI